VWFGGAPGVVAVVGAVIEAEAFVVAAGGRDRGEDVGVDAGAGPGGGDGVGVEGDGTHGAGVGGADAPARL
jgi:hypothetical protein